MQKNSLGRLISCGPGLERPTVLLRDLAYPYGLAIAQDHKTLWLTQSWNHRLSRASLQGQAIGPALTVIGNLPGYPARLARAGRSGFWLSVFAVRTHLVEFVLREDDFREEMMQTIEPAIWVGPSLTSGEDCHEPMQFGWHQGARHREAVGAAAFLRLWSRASMRKATRWRACTAGSAAVITASPPRARRRRVW